MTDDPSQLSEAADWDRKADQWDRQVGEDGDRNRRLNSDPVLWRLLGPVAGMRVLDAGCGTGYLSRQLARAGARTIGVDVSPGMIGIARSRADAAGLAIDHRVDSCADLASQLDSSIEALVSNYVLMDLADLHGAMRAFHRVLVPGGRAVLILSHPCFPQGGDARVEDGVVNYRWPWNYFTPTRRVDPPWGNFDQPFTWHHRPLSAYWQAFRAAGFAVEDLAEPRLDAERAHEARTERELFNATNRPYSIAFALRRPA